MKMQPMKMGENPEEETTMPVRMPEMIKKKNGQKADAKDPAAMQLIREDTASASNTCTISISCATILEQYGAFKEQQGRVLFRPMAGFWHRRK